jgi:hypothetical protein
MLEILGLILAIVDFCGLTETLEKKVDLSRQKLQAFTTSRFENATEIFLNWFNGVCFVILWAYLLYKSVDHFLTNPPPDLPELPLAGRIIVWLVGTFIVAFFGTGVYAVILLFALIAIHYTVLWPLVLILRLLDMPKKGTVGSIGLLLAVAGVAIRFMHG